ncbi:MAG TPA: ATP-binding protein [Polyangiaceae bacterium]
MTHDPSRVSESPTSQVAAPSTRRITPAETQELLVLEKLLHLSLGFSIEADVEAIVSRFVEGLGELAPNLAIGVCVVSPDGSGSRVFYRLPSGANPDPGRDPTRLFPGFSHERVIAIDSDNAGSTLHLACDDPEELADRTRIFDRAAPVLSAALDRSRAFRSARESSDGLRRLQARVIQAEKLGSLGQIVAGLVHELNNPLTSILAYTDYLKKKMERSRDGGVLDEDLERLRRIDEAAHRILKFSRDLVAYARPTQDIPGVVRLHEVLNQALVFCEHEFAPVGVQVERDFAESFPPVLGIAGQLTQVFVNLFTNAVHAMRGREGRLTVSVKLADNRDALVVEVSDNGAGISAEDMNQIFEPFFTTKRDDNGSGLGLSIVRDIVTAHGGSLWARSTPGEGSVFSVVLPLAAITQSLLPPGPR